MNWSEFFGLGLSWGASVRLSIGIGLILVVFAVLALLFFLRRRRGFTRHWDAVEADIALGGVGHVKIVPNDTDIQLAHRAWVQLATRKAGVPIDREHDVIHEVYDSWYELFRELRALASECPARKVRKDRDTRELVETIVKVLNQGLRPHLTEWQAKYRRWYEGQEKNLVDKTPQEIQKTYPQYEALMSDLERVSRGLVEYMDLLRRLSAGERVR